MPQPFVAMEAGRAASLLQERVPPSNKPQAKRRPQLVLEQGLEAFPSARVVQRQVLLPWFPFLPETADI